MKNGRTILVAALLTLARMAAAEQTDFAKPDERLQRIVDAAVAAAFKQFASNQLQSNQLAVTLVDLRDAAHLKRASFRGDVPIYPASVSRRAWPSTNNPPGASTRGKFSSSSKRCAND